MKAEKVIVFALLAILLLSTLTIACGGGASTRDKMINRALGHVASLSDHPENNCCYKYQYMSWEWQHACNEVYTVDDPPLYGRVESSKLGIWHIQVCYGVPHYGVQLGTWSVREDTGAVLPVGYPALHVHGCPY